MIGPLGRATEAYEARDGVVSSRDYADFDGALKGVNVMGVSCIDPNELAFEDDIVWVVPPEELGDAVEEYFFDSPTRVDPPTESDKGPDDVVVGYSTLRADAPPNGPDPFFVGSLDTPREGFFCRRLFLKVLDDFDDDVPCEVVAVKSIRPGVPGNPLS